MDRREYKARWEKAHKKRRLFLYARKRSRNKNIEFTITEDDIEIPQVCPVLHIPIVIGGVYDNRPSLDKVNNNLGYIKGNVKIISLRANRIKSDASIEELRNILSYMEDHIILS